MGTKKTYRVGIIGAGSIAQACHGKGYAAHPQAELVACADPVRARHAEMRELFGDIRGYTTYKEMLAKENLDVVSVCTPNKFHAAATIAALEAGCHVLCEKPMAMSLREADRMAEAAKKARKKLMIGFTHRMIAGPIRCKELIKEKAIGKPFMIRVRFAHDGPYPGWAKGDWFYKAALAGGGAMYDMGIHAIDLCLWILGPITAVTAQTATIFKRIEVDDNAVLLLEFKSGALGYIEVGWTSKPGFNGLEIYGKEGTLICDYLRELQLCSGKASAGTDSVTHWETIEKAPAAGGWAVEIDHWMNVVMGKERLTMNAAAGRDALEVALAAYKSSKTGRRIAIG